MQAAALADEHGIPALSWEAHAALARLGYHRAEHRAAAESEIERIASRLNDEMLRDCFLKRVRP
jgi:hypothetical protein